MTAPRFLLACRSGPPESELARVPQGDMWLAPGYNTHH
jgi:hypothetical protein